MTRRLILWMLLFSTPILNLSAQQLYINEVMAVNSSTLADEFGEYDDWIEIYNASASDIDLAGYYISDDLANPLLWQIPSDNAAETTVPAGGFLLLWADKDPEQGAHHLDFKLSGDGETLRLSTPFQTLVNEVSFGEQFEDISHGRTLDGGNAFDSFYSPSPGLSNSTPAANPTFEIIFNTQISHINDDAEQNTGGSSVNLTSGDIEIGVDGSSEQRVGFRFPNLNLPEGTSVTEAYLQFTVDEASLGDADITIWADAAASAASFDDINLVDRTTTDAEVEWSPVEWPSKEVSGAAQRTPNLSALMNEVLAHPNWEAGNHMAFLMEGSGSRIAVAYDNEPLAAAILSIKAQYPASTAPVTGLVINEIAAHGSNYLDESGKGEDWVELYNPSNETIFVGGLYLSDDVENPTKWQVAAPVSIEPQGFLTIFCDKDPEEGGLHTNFKLSNDGETVVLSQVLGNEIITIDEVTFGAMDFKATYGRETDGADEFVLFGEDTGNASNEGALLYLAPPTFSVTSGLYQSAQSLTLSHPVSGVDIYYTTGGNLPDDGEDEYNGTIDIEQSEVIRAIAYKAGYAPSHVVNESYVIDFEAIMPILHITTDPDNFFDDEIGIYVVGTNGVIDYCETYPANFAQNWERPVNLKMILPDGEVAFDVNAGVKIAGACSREKPVKSLNIFLREDVYGNKNISYPLYEAREHNDYQRLKLRNAGQDFVRTGCRDAINHSLLVGALDVDVQANRSVIVFLNGEFWAVQNLRENYHGEYFDAIFGVKERNIDIIKSPGIPWRDVKEGSDEAYLQFFDWVQNSDFENEADYAELKERLDWDEFINYWITTTYMANYDWPANNLGVWRENKEGKKWRYLIQDTDGSTGNGLSSAASAPYNTLDVISDENSTGWPNHKNSTLVLRKLWENEEFRNEYIQRTCSIINLLYTPERVNHLADSVQALYTPYVPLHIDKWVDDEEHVMGGEVEDWLHWMDEFREFYDLRRAYFKGFMEDKWDLNGEFDLHINFDANSGGRVVVNYNEMEIPYQYTGPYMRNVPLRLTAIANDGYEFSHWEETGETEAVIDFQSSNDITYTPIFELPCDFTTQEDLDADGICDEFDNCPNTANPEQADEDNDGIGNLCDDCNNNLTGTTCNDNDPCTENDVYDADCNCAGTFADEDNDGICNANDPCNGNLFGTPCDDGDVCTILDFYDDNCDCVGIYNDEDNDGVCDGEDICPGFDDNIDENGDGIPDACFVACETGDQDGDGICAEDDCDDTNPNLPLPIGTPCDDENPASTDDQIQLDGCTCAGTILNTEYCEASSNWPWHEYISHIIFNEIDHASLKKPYSDFTDVQTILSPSLSFDIQLAVKYSWYVQDNYWHVWIDFNQNLNFDANELVVSTPHTGTMPGSAEFTTATIDVPSNALLGPTRMRIIMNRESLPMPCGLSEFGEVEDYTVVLGTNGLGRQTQAATLALETPKTMATTKQTIRVYPNPASRLLHIALPTDLTDNSQIYIYNTLGVKVLQQTIQAGGLVELQVQDWNKGVYWLAIEQANQERIMQSFIVQ